MKELLYTANEVLYMEYSFLVQSMRCHIGDAACLENITEKKVINRPTQTPQCGFVVAACEPLKFYSDEHIFERFSFFYE